MYMYLFLEGFPGNTAASGERCSAQGQEGDSSISLKNLLDFEPYESMNQQKSTVK